MAEIAYPARGLVTEVPVDSDCGVDQASVVNCDGLHTVSQRPLPRRIGSAEDDTLEELGEAVAAALGRDRR